MLDHEDRELRDLLRKALEAANLNRRHASGHPGGTYRHIADALENLAPGEVERWSEAGEWPLEVDLEVEAIQLRQPTDSYVVDAVPSAFPGQGGTVRLLDRRPLGLGFAIRLPSGMCHAFDTREEAEASQYWPRQQAAKR